MSSICVCLSIIKTFYLCFFLAGTISVCLFLFVSYSPLFLFFFADCQNGLNCFLILLIGKKGWVVWQQLSPSRRPTMNYGMRKGLRSTQRCVTKKREREEKECMLERGERERKRKIKYNVREREKKAVQDI